MEVDENNKTVLHLCTFKNADSKLWLSLGLGLKEKASKNN